MNYYKAIYAGTIATFIWTCFPVLCKYSLPHTSVSQFLIIRYIVTFSLLAYLTPRVFKKFHHLSWVAWLSICLIVSLHNICQTFCLKEVPVSWYILFYSASPVLTYLILPGKKQVTSYIYSILAILGTIIFLRFPKIDVTVSTLSLICLFISITTWSILTYAIIYFHKQYTDLEVTYILNLCNFISAIIIFYISGSNFNIGSSISLIPIILIGITSPLASVLFSFSLRFVPQFGISSQYLELVFGLLIGYVLFEEIPSYYQYIGSALIITSLIGTTLHTHRNAKLK